MVVRIKDRSELMEMLKCTAPGTYLREGLDNVLRANTGALIVLGHKDSVLPLTSGGFDIDTQYSPAKLYELAKMDGAIILSDDAQRIISANTHLNPDRDIPSGETGIRHRTAEQTARQTDHLVICISQRRQIITLYKGNIKYALRDSTRLLNTANQAIQTLERYRLSLERALLRLSLGEFDYTVNLSDVVQVIQRAEMFNRVSEELTLYITELGTESRMVRMQSEELISDVEDEERLTIRDYIVFDKEKEDLNEALDRVLEELHNCNNEEILDRENISRILGYENLSQDGHRRFLMPPGFRILYKIPRLPSNVIENLIDHFADFKAINLATLEELDEVDGVGPVRAKQILRGLERLRAQILADGNWR